MKIRRFYGKNMREALDQVKAELGGDAVIMSNKKVENGIEIVAAYDNEPVSVPPKIKTKTSVTKDTPSLSEIIGDSGPDSLRELLEKQANSQINEQPAKSSVVGSSQSAVDLNRKSQDSSDIAEIREELSALRNVLEFQVSGLLAKDNRRENPLQSYLVDRLRDMGISDKIAREVVSYTPDDTNEREAWLFLLNLLSNKIACEDNAILNERGVVALVGPTGTGKTTTVAKLAARYAQKYGPDQIALVTIDSFRIAAYEQLATYGKIIGCSVKKAQNEAELADVLFQLRNKRLILVDTAGFGQRDSRLIKQLDTLNQNSCANIKKYLLLQANSQYKVMQHTISMYKQISLQGCIFTKLDECYSLGEAISVAIEHRLPVSYITDGQRVPEDIKVAEAKLLVSMAAKLYKHDSIAKASTVDENQSAVAV